MLNVPSILYINCIGSYYYSILENLNNDAKYHELLLYLSQGKLVYEAKDKQDIYAKYKNNPWGYQPISIRDIENKEIRIDRKFYEFLEHSLNVIIKKEDISHEEYIEDRIIHNMRNGFYSIIDVDEFYIPSSKKCFEKSHNKHSLLVKNINADNKSIEMIDSEENNTVEIQIRDLKRSILMSEFSHNYIYNINTTNYFNDPKRTINNEFEITHFFDADFIDFWIGEIYTNSSEEMNYYFRGYYYNILSKIIPYVSMLYYMAESQHLDICDKVLSILKEWRALCTFMRVKIIKGNCDYEYLIRQLMNIKEKYISFCQC